MKHKFSCAISCTCKDMKNRKLSYRSMEDGEYNWRTLIATEFFYLDDHCILQNFVLFSGL